MDVKESSEPSTVNAYSTEQDESGHAVGKRKGSSVSHASICVENTSDEESLSDAAAPQDQATKLQDGKAVLKGSSHSSPVTHDNSVPAEEPLPLPDPRIAKQQARLDILKAQLEELTNEIDNNKALLRHSDASATVARHIKLLHEYNEIRDIGLGLMGMVAERRAVRIAQVMAEYGIGDGD